MVQLDWLRQMRQARRLSIVRTSRRPLPSPDLAEVLEPRCVLSAVQTGMPLDDSVNVDDSTAPNDVAAPVDAAVNDGATDPNATSASLDGGNDPVASDNVKPDQSTGDQPVKINFYSLGAGNVDAVPSPYFSESELRDYLLNLAQQRWSSLFGQTIPQSDYGWRMLAMNGIASDALPPAANDAGSNRVQSSTNTQVAGVDEADFVETDGQFIYVARGNGLTIVDTTGDRGLSVASKTSLSGNVLGEFMSGDRLTVITQSGFGGWYGGGMNLAAARFMRPWNWQPQTNVTVFDVSDRTAPSIVQQTILHGSFQSARAIGNTVYVIVQDQLNLPEPLFTDTPVTDNSSVDPTVTTTVTDGADGSVVAVDPPLVDPRHRQNAIRGR